MRPHKWGQITEEIRLNGEAEHHAVRVVGTGVIVVAAVVDVVEVAIVVRRAEPPKPSAVIAALFHAVSFPCENIKLRVLRLSFGITTFAENLSSGQAEKVVLRFYSLTVHDLYDSGRFDNCL